MGGFEINPIKPLKLKFYFFKLTIRKPFYSYNFS